MDNDIPEFADVVRDRDVLDGDKIPIEQLKFLPDSSGMYYKFCRTTDEK